MSASEVGMEDTGVSETISIDGGSILVPPELSLILPLITAVIGKPVTNASSSSSSSTTQGYRGQETDLLFLVVPNRRGSQNGYLIIICWMRE